MTSVAAVLCGKEPTLVQYMIQNLQPKIEIVHHCDSVDTALSEIPALLRGEAIRPSSGFGTNVKGPARNDVQLILIGGAFAEEDVSAILAAVEDVKPLAFFRTDPGKVPSGTPGRPPPEAIRTRILNCVEAEEQPEGHWAPGVYLF